MTRIVYVNGAYKRYGEAAIHVEDRGFQFADAVYEVIEVLGGRLVDANRHLARLERSLRDIAADAGKRLASHHWRGHSAKSRSRRHRLHAGDARSGPARVCFTRPGRFADARRFRPHPA